MFFSLISLETTQLHKKYECKERFSPFQLIDTRVNSLLSELSTPSLSTITSDLIDSFSLVSVCGYNYHRKYYKVYQSSFLF